MFIPLEHTAHSKTNLPKINKQTKQHTHPKKRKKKRRENKTASPSQLFGINHIVKDHSDNEDTNYHHFMGYFLFFLTSTYHSFCYTSCGALAVLRNNSMGPPWRIDPTTHCTMSRHFTQTKTTPKPFWQPQARLINRERNMLKLVWQTTLLVLLMGYREEENRTLWWSG